MVLMHLLKTSGYNVSLAHCNFKLRGIESDQDEDFCSLLAEQSGLKIYLKQFDTLSFSKDANLSIQMAARQLRYNWFKELLVQDGYNYVLTAHHAGDQIETLLINLLRGTGIKGLLGIPEKQNHIVRPLLFASRDLISSYASENKLQFRNDSSNDEVKYKRNFLRHKVIPRLKELNPALEKTFEKNIKLFEQTADVVRLYTESQKQFILTTKDDCTEIDIEALLKNPNKDLLLYDWLQLFDFNTSTVSQLLESLREGMSGKLFYSSSYRALIDRQKIIIEPISDKGFGKEYQINNLNDTSHLPISVSADLISGYSDEASPNIAYINFEKINFPLTLRKWKQGDRFMPLGMKHFKKLSDFFISSKLSRFDKENVWLLCNSNDIVWVIGYRLDERYKVTQATNSVLKLTYKNN